MRIFVIDDDPAMVELVARVCSKAGHEVSTYTSSARAVEALASNTVDLVITDLVMPPPDGMAVLREVRRLHSEAMALAITGHANDNTLEQVLAAGATDLLFKPFRLDELRIRIQLANDRKALVDALHHQRRAIQTMSAEMIGGLQEELIQARTGAPSKR
jgi:DNA-binding response OmpR family regulator